MILNHMYSHEHNYKFLANLWVERQLDPREMVKRRTFKSIDRASELGAGGSQKQQFSKHCPKFISISRLNFHLRPSSSCRSVESCQRSIVTRT